MRINYNAAQPGANRLIQAFTSGTRQKAEENEMLRLAQVDQRVASAGKDNADANLLNQRGAYLDDLPGFLSNQTGAPLPLAKKYADYNKTGNWGQIEPPTSTDAEGELLAGLSPTPITEVPEEIKGLMDQFKRALQTYGGVRGASASNPEQIAKSQTEYQQQAVTDNAVDLAQQGKVDQASALSQAGKIGQQIKRFDGITGTGAVFNPATGEVVATGNPLVDAFIKKLGKDTVSDGDSSDDANAPWAKIKDSKKQDEARIRFGIAADKTVDDMKEDSKKAKDMNNSLDRFIFLNEKNKTGGAYNSSIARGVGKIINSEFEEMMSLSDKLTPAMRQGLPGAASDRDISMFRGATVGVEKLPQANKNIAHGLKVANENTIDRVKFMNDYLTQNNHLRGADEAWSQYLDANPIFDPTKPEGSYQLNNKRVKYDKWKNSGQTNVNSGAGKGKFLGFE